MEDYLKVIIIILIIILFIIYENRHFLKLSYYKDDLTGGGPIILPPFNLISISGILSSVVSALQAAGHQFDINKDIEWVVGGVASTVCGIFSSTISGGMSISSFFSSILMIVAIFLVGIFNSKAAGTLAEGTVEIAKKKI